MRWTTLTLSLCLTPALLAAAPPEVKIVEAKGHLDFMVGGELAARYHTGDDLRKPYFWPVNAPGGVPATRGWPMEEAPEGGSKDHVHQKSVWFCHGDVIPEGLELDRKVGGVDGVDFWSEHPNAGRIACVGYKILRGEPGTARVATTNIWRTADGEPILDEHRLIGLTVTENGWLLTIESELLAKYYPITFGDTKEGSMGVRVNDQIREKNGNGTMTSSADKSGSGDLWGRVADWIDYSGEVDGKPVGVAVFDDPDNTVRACWHARDYGLLAANPFGRQRSGFPDRKGETDLVKIDKGETLRFRYGVYVHTGDVKTGNVSEAFEAFKKK